MRRPDATALWKGRTAGLANLGQLRDRRRVLLRRRRCGEFPPDAVTVIVTGSFGPRQGDTILFSDASGNVLGTGITGTDGAFSMVVPAGSQATALYNDNLNRAQDLMTFIDVAPGDVLTVYDIAPAVPVLDIPSIPPSPPAGTEEYEFEVGQWGGEQTSCVQSDTSPPYSISMQPLCDPFGQFPLLVIALDDNSIPLGFASHKGGTYRTLDTGGNGSVSVGGAWSTSLGNATVTATNIPSTLPNVTVAFAEVASGLPYSNAKSFSTPTAGNTASQTFQTHVGSPDSVMSEAVVSNGGDNALQAIATRSAPPATTATTTTTLDMSQLLPAINGMTNTATATGATISWTSAAPITGATGTVVVLELDGTNGTGEEQLFWNVVVPPDATSFSTPQIPTSAAAWVPNASFHVIGHVTTMKGLSGLTTYAAFRAAASSLVTTAGAVGPVVPPLPVDGTMVVTAYTPP